MDENVVRGFNQRLINISAYTSQARARLIDMSEWNQRDGSGLLTLNDMIEWLGFKRYRFPSLLYSNKNEYGIDNQNYSLGDHCQKMGTQFQVIPGKCCSNLGNLKIHLNKK